METINRKERVRINRGVLKYFSELPMDKQIIFKNIKKTINLYLNKETNVYVFGSFYWGFWDETSDFDVTIEYEFNNYKMDKRANKISEITSFFSEKGIKIDIIIKRGKMGILIP